MLLPSDCVPVLIRQKGATTFITITLIIMAFSPGRSDDDVLNVAPRQRRVGLEGERDDGRSHWSTGASPGSNVRKRFTVVI